MCIYRSTETQTCILWTPQVRMCLYTEEVQHHPPFFVYATLQHHLIIVGVMIPNIGNPEVALKLAVAGMCDLKVQLILINVYPNYCNS